MADEQQLRFLIAAGGTVGHVAPALAVAEALRRRGGLVTFAGSPDRVEARLVPERGYEFDAFAVSGLPRRPGVALLRAAGQALTAPAACLRILRPAPARRRPRRRRLRRRADGARRAAAGDPVRAHRGGRAPRAREPARRAARRARLPRAPAWAARGEVPRRSGGRSRPRRVRVDRDEARSRARARPSTPRSYSSSAARSARGS